MLPTPILIKEWGFKFMTKRGDQLFAAPMAAIEQKSALHFIWSMHVGWWHPSEKGTRETCIVKWRNRPETDPSCYLSLNALKAFAPFQAFLLRTTRFSNDQPGLGDCTMGASSSSFIHEEGQEDLDDDGEELRRRMRWIKELFPIESSVDDAVPPDSINPPDSIDPSDSIHSAASTVSSHREQTAFQPFAEPTPAFLTRLPMELIQTIVGSLDNRSIKNLRLTCRYFAATAALRIPRVFLSANPLNIQVFRSIADHDVYRHKVIEIIYDDARLWRSAVDEAEARDPGISLWVHADMPADMDWFRLERNENLEELRQRRRHDDDMRPEHLATARCARAELPMQESWTYYHDLLRQQDEVIDSGADEEALRYGLQRFPALRKVTVTPEAHGWLFKPLYETPMIRAFPQGFNYPIPRGWPYSRLSTLNVAPWEESKERWRGCTMITKILAQEQQHHQVSEYAIDGHNLGTGLNCRIFEQPCQEYSDLVSVLQQPGFKKLSLSLFVDGIDNIFSLNWRPLNNGRLRDALAEATQLEHISLATGWNPDGRDDPPELSTFLPVSRWARLQHFELWHVSVRQGDLVSTLSLLPEGLRSVQLNYLNIHQGSYSELLNEMRDTLRWHERQTRPDVKVGALIDPYVRGRGIWLDNEIDDFLYHGGENPFERKPSASLHPVGFGMGTVRDAFDPDHERPWVDDDEYQKLGFHKTYDWEQIAKDYNVAHFYSPESETDMSN